jgi:hypothetical protein
MTATWFFLSSRHGNRLHLAAADAVCGRNAGKLLATRVAVVLMTMFWQRRHDARHLQCAISRCKTS